MSMFATKNRQHKLLEIHCRKFIKGDGDMKAAFATRLAGSADLYHQNQRYTVKHPPREYSLKEVPESETSRL